MRDQEAIYALKRNKLVEQKFKCAYCGNQFKLSDKMELAHILPQRKYLIKKYGEEIIHHELNMKLTHAGECNSGIQMSPNKIKLVEAHVAMIKEAIDAE
jgi:5-methylcytosine-specific restriction endonuclease McrA